MKKFDKFLLFSYISYISLFLLIFIFGITGVFADTFDNFEVTWYYRNKNNETQLLNVLKQEDVPLYASTSEYVNGYTTRVEQTFIKELQYIVNYQLQMWFSPEQELNYRSDTLQRILDYSYVDSDFKILNVLANENWNRSSGTGDTVLTINVSMQVLALNNTDAIRFGVYTTNNISIGFYNHTDEIDYYLVNNISIEENANATIIDQNNQIINGQNSLQNSITNTQDSINQNIDDMEQSIIDSNKDTQDVIKDQFNNCKIIDKNSILTSGYRLTGAGGMVENSSTGITDFISINSNMKLQITNNASGYVSCFYDNSKRYISCFQNGSVALNTDIEIPNNAKYFKATIYTSSGLPSFKLCSNKIDETNNQLNDLNNNLNNSDSTGATNDASNFFSNFTTDTFGLTSIITAPLSLINTITSSSCSTLRLPLPYLDNKYLELPCMNTIYTEYFGSFFNIYQTITFGIIAYWVIVRIFNQVKDFKNPDHDEIEVLDL